MDRYTEEMKLWLFDLVHGNLDDDRIVKGFIRHYALHGLAVGNVKDDILFHTRYGIQNVKKAQDGLEKALRNYAGLDGKGGVSGEGSVSG